MASSDLFGLDGSSYFSTQTTTQHIVLDAGWPVTITRLIIKTAGTSNSVHHLELRASNSDSPSSFALVPNGELTLQQSASPQSFHAFHAKFRYWVIVLVDNFGGSGGMGFDNLALYAPEAPWSPSMLCAIN